MEFYNNPSNVDEYEKMCDEYDGSELYSIIDRYLENGSSLLELGCGPGNDIANLIKKYQVTGSDLSEEFLTRCKKKFPTITLLKLDAVTIETEKTFECVFSNKVLHHLKMQQLEESLNRQQSVISKKGIFAHTFWLGDKEFTMEGMLFVFHNRAKLIALVSKYFTILETYDYKEFEEGDSILVIARNSKST